MAPAFIFPVTVTSSIKSSFHQPLIFTAPRKYNVARSVVTRAVADAPTQPAGKSEVISESIKSNVMNTYGRYPITISHGKGVRLYDIEGNCYLDMVAGIATCLLGHAHPAIVEAICDQVRKVTHVSNLYYIPGQADLSEWLVKHSPADRVFFCNSGAEANEGAIKLARKRWHMKHGSTTTSQGNPVIVTAHMSFHGRTLGTMTATGQAKIQNGFWPLVDGFEYVTYNDVDDLQRTCERIGDNLAGVMLETLQGEGGVRPATIEFMKAARDVCDRADALLIYDEVQVGMGRTGTMWGFDRLGVTPDVFTLAKGLGGGVPIGAMLCREHCNVLGPGEHGTTFGGNPLAMAAGLAVATQLTETDIMHNVRARSKQLFALLNAIVVKYPALVKEVRGFGLIAGLEMGDAKVADVISECQKRKLLVLPAGATVVRFVPAFVITEDEVSEAIEIFEEALVAAANL